MPRSFPGTRTYSRSTSLSGRASPRAADPETDNSAMPYFWHSSASRSPSALISSRVTRVAPSADLRNILRRTQSGTRMHWCAAARLQRGGPARLDLQCAMCGFGGVLGHYPVAIEAAHVAGIASRAVGARWTGGHPRAAGPGDWLSTLSEVSDQKADRGQPDDKAKPSGLTEAVPAAPVCRSGLPR